MERLSRRNFIKRLGLAVAGSALPQQIDEAGYKDLYDDLSEEVATAFKPPFSKEDLMAVGVGEFSAEKLLKVTPTLLEAENAILNVNRDAGENVGIPFEVFACLLLEENSLDIASNSIHGPYEISTKKYNPRVTTPTNLLHATYDLVSFLTEKGKEIGIDPHVKDAKMENLSLWKWGFLAANYNGITEPVEISGQKIYGYPETGIRDWRLSPYAVNNYNEVAALFGYPFLKSEEEVKINTQRMPVRFTYPYPVPLPEEESDKYFAEMEKDGFLAFAIRLIEAQKLAQKKAA